MTPQQKAKIIAGSSLLGYAAVQFPDYKISSHHKRIAEALQQVERGEITRLIITMPPRHGKSMLASEYFPAWYLGRNPENQVIAATYSQDLASTFGRKVRNQLIDPMYKAIFSIQAADDSASASQVMTTKGGVYNAVGVGGALTGRGAHLLLIDDPLKGREEADSELIRRKQREWYNAVAYTRLMPNGCIVIIQTRWHEDDLAGYVLREHAHEGWVELTLPAINDNGQALWEAQYPIEQLERIKKTIGAREWNALYQQRPVADEGDYFKRDWFRWFDPSNPPLHLRTYLASDWAVTDGGGDFTEHGMFGVCPDDNLYVLDWWSGQTAPDVWIDAALDLVNIHKPLKWFGEAGVIRRSIEPFLNKRMRERRVYCHVDWITSTTDKPSRSRGFQARASMGKVYLPKNDLGEAILDQLLRFPAGKYDDKVDVCGLIGRGIDSMVGGSAPVVQQVMRRAMYDREEIDEDNWRLA